MNKNEFFNKYLPLIGKKVTDNLFNTKKLTKTAILNKYIELYTVPTIKKEYETENTDNITYYLIDVVSVAEGVLNMQRNQKQFYNPSVLPFSLGNSKIGKDTLCISLNSSMLCYMGITGNCSNFGICYGCNSNKMYSNEFKKNTLSQIHFIQTETDKLIAGTITAIKNSLSKKELSNLKFLRFNINGDILNNEQLIKANAIAEALKTEFGLIRCYSYTHNQQLDLNLATGINFNTSDHYKEGFKSCQTIFEFDLMNYDENNFILCNGDCNGCSYCKFEFETRTVLFMAHGGKFKGLEGINEYFLSYLDYNKQIDYMICLRMVEGV